MPMKKSAKKALKKVVKLKKVAKRVIKKKVVKAVKRKVAKAVLKKKVAKKVVRAAMIVKPEVGSKPFKRAQMLRYLAAVGHVSKTQAAAVVDALVELIGTHLKHRGPGEFTLAGLAKFRVMRKPSTPAREGRNPFTGEMMTFAAKPARNIVKIRALKKLKDLAA